MSEENQISENNNKKTKGKIPGILLRLFLATFVGLIIGVVIYYSAAGWIPYIDQEIIQPIDENQADLEVVVNTQQALQTQISDLQDQLDISRTAITELESTLQNEAEIRIGLQSTIDTNTENLLEQTQSIEMLNTNLKDTDQNLAALATAQLNNIWIINNINLLKIVDTMTLANQYLINKNFGLAENELTLAIEMVSAMLDSSPAHHHPYLLSILELIEGGIKDLPDNSVLTIEKIQLARQLAYQGLPEPSEGTSTPTPYLTPTATTTPDS